MRHCKKIAQLYFRTLKMFFLVIEFKVLMVSVSIKQLVGSDNFTKVWHATPLQYTVSNYYSMPL